ncbi:hypothetical protein K435DRAFT_826551 [Dendrothele bispora CBS 962.96]|uniref:RING-type E3 ubiquitin transferase n=1 Tax=Dendrothele bispora (strain CBS 962.96) TaxID=1314807 RepID=A0A4S8MPU2_DENBC|nr:hypothetical protein K435DRAFT_826551 [Dendrothele bispora CBS 962.96]
MSTPYAGPSSARKLFGPIPGLLDPSQTQRLLRFPSSRLSFASFHPLTATSNQDTDFRKLSLQDDLCKAKRVVIETTPTGESYWRFVPKAQLDQGVSDEGQWPRLVNLCGQLVECSQDQWDIYKLDPFYDCRVYLPPTLSAITHAPKPHTTPVKTGKRPAPVSEQSMPPLNPRKKLNTSNTSTPNTSISLDNEDEDEDEDEEEEEVEDMVIDDIPPRRARSASASERTRKFREKIVNNRKERREKVAKRARKLDNLDDNVFFDFGATEDSFRAQSNPLENGEPKRKASFMDDPIRYPDPDYLQSTDAARKAFNYEQTDTGKRTRTVSPTAARRELDAKKFQREKRRQERRHARVSGRRQQWHEQFMREVYAQVPEMGPPPMNDEQNDIYDDVESSESDEEGPDDMNGIDEEAARVAAISESRRKMAELERDRPLWEAEAKKRALREKAEEEARRLQAEQKKWAEARKAEEARRKAEAREREEPERRAREEATRRQRERRQRQDRWQKAGSWTNQSALERYRMLSETFDTAKFSTSNPLSFEEVPWPVLKNPGSLSVEDIDWASVEQFFEHAKYTFRGQEYKTLVEKTQRRFHPDRWRSRGLLKTITDDVERESLEIEKRISGPHSANPSNSFHATLPSQPIPESSRSPALRTSPIPPSPPQSATLRPPVPETASAIPQLPSNPYQPPPSWFGKMLLFLGYGRNASRSRRLLVSLISSIVWGSMQVITIIAVLASSAPKPSPKIPGVNEWQACDRPLGVWLCLWIVRVFLASSLSYWSWTKDRASHADRADPEAGTSSSEATLHPRPAGSPSYGNNHRTNRVQGTSDSGRPSENAPLPQSHLYRRLSLLSSLLSLTWFLTAHILVYTSANTCRFSAPHIWWLSFAILCITYLVILEVIVLALVVFVIAPFLFLVWNILLILLGRHPLQNPHMIKPEVGKLPKTMVDTIPLVMYIPPPPDAPPSEGPIKVPDVAYTYPPKPSSIPPPTRRRFRFIRKRSSKPHQTSDQKTNKGSNDKGTKDTEAPVTWEDRWEKEGYPFVVLEGNRAACAICLMDFEEPKRIDTDKSRAIVTVNEASTPGSNNQSQSEGNITEVDRQLQLEDAGDGAQPLRLLTCGHVFHKTCLDPWLIDVSGRCPTCQRPVEFPEQPKKKKRNR